MVHSEAPFRAVPAARTVSDLATAATALGAAAAGLRGVRGHGSGPGTFFWNTFPTRADTRFDFFRPEWIKGAALADGTRCVPVAELGRSSTKGRSPFHFDTGVAHAIAGTESIDRNSDLYGRSFEHFMAMELRAFLSYRRNRLPLSYWRSKHGYEVDFIVGDETAIKVKATRHVVDRDLRGVKALKEERLVKRFFLVSQDDIDTTRDGIACVNWRTFLERLWEGRIV